MRQAWQDADLGTASWDTVGSACFGSSKFDYSDAQTEAPDGSESWSTLGLSSWKTSFVGEELGMPRPGPPGDLATGHPLGSLAEQAREGDQGGCSEVAKDLSKGFR